MRYSRILFICNDNTALSPLAAWYMRKYLGDECVIYSRGIVVLYPEPYNPKVYEILSGDGIVADEESQSRRVTASDFSSTTLVLTMDERQKQHIYDQFQDAINVYTIKEFALRAEVDNPDIKEPYGLGMEGYKAIYEEIKGYLDMIIEYLTHSKKEGIKEDDSDSM
jgi:protein-tyrosine-phosphatase